jgi:iron complex transport system substrate-binding protein
MRIVSLLPSATEIVCRLGRGRDLVGRSAECDYPELVGALPVVMRARTLDAERPSSEIDRRVREERARGESLYELDAELLRTLQPDVLITQDLCGVCSVTGDEVRAACASAGITPRIVELTPRSLDDVRATIRDVAGAIGAEDPGDSLDLELRSRQAAVVERPRGATRRIAVVEWLDPPILAGLWAPEMVQLGGGTVVGAVQPREPGVRTTWRELEDVRPDLVIVSPCSFRVERTLRELEGPLLGEARDALASVESWVVDEAYFSRPGPRLWDGIELIARAVDGALPDGPMPVLRLDRARRIAGVAA